MQFGEATSIVHSIITHRITSFGVPLFLIIKSWRNVLVFQLRWLELLKLGCCLLQFVGFKPAPVLSVGFNLWRRVIYLCADLLQLLARVCCLGATVGLLLLSYCNCWPVFNLLSYYNCWPAFAVLLQLLAFFAVCASLRLARQWMKERGIRVQSFF